MAGRHDSWRRLRGGADRPELIGLGEKMLGYLVEQRKLGLAKSHVITRTMSDGSVIRAQFVDDQPLIEIRQNQSSSGTEEVLQLFVSSPGGLRIFDLGTKTLVKTVTGLGDYTLQGVDAPGKLAYMAYNPGTSTYAACARVDIGAMSAFAHTYTINAPDSGDSSASVPGFASLSQLAKLSPDGSRLLFSFGGTQVDGSLVEGVGGFLLLDAETLDMVRPAIRMTFEPAPFAWAPDSQTFALGTPLADDPGDAGNNDRFSAITTSEADYVAVFDRNGTLLGSRQVATWTFTPDGGFARRVIALTFSADGKRLLALVDVGDHNELMLIDAADPTLPVLATITLDITTQILLAGRNDTVTLLADDTTAGNAIEVSFEGDLLGVVTTATSEDLLTFAPTRNPGFDALQNGPNSRYGNPPDLRRFLMRLNHVTGSYDAVVAFRAIDSPNVYEIDLTAYNVHINYRIASVGTRPLLRNQK